MNGNTVKVRNLCCDTINTDKGKIMKRTNAINEAFACVIVCALAFGLTFITAAGWML